MAEYLRPSPWSDYLFWWEYGYGVEKNRYLPSTTYLLYRRWFIKVHLAAQSVSYEPGPWLAQTSSAENDLVLQIYLWRLESSRDSSHEVTTRGMHPMDPKISTRYHNNTPETTKQRTKQLTMRPISTLNIITTVPPTQSMFPIQSPCPQSHAKSHPTSQVPPTFSYRSARSTQ